MARANRHRIPGYIWHIIHRCHKKEFLLKFALKSMNTTKLKQIYLAFLITGFFLIPSVLGASDSISLTDHEKKLIEQGDIIVREVETVGKDGKTFEAIGFINASRGTILQVLSEYEKYPEFMPNVSHVEIVEQIDHASILNYTLTLPLGKIIWSLWGRTKSTT